MQDSPLSHGRYEAALEICRAVPFCLDFERHGCGGAYVINHRLEVVLWSFEDSAPAGWAEDVLKGIEEAWGIGGARGKGMVGS